MAPNSATSTSVNRFIYTSKRCLKVFRSLRSKKPKPTGEESPSLRRESFYLSSVSLEKRRPSEQSIDTIITLLDETCTLDNRVNEKIEQLTLIDGLV